MEASLYGQPMVEEKFPPRGDPDPNANQVMPRAQYAAEAAILDSACNGGGLAFADNKLFLGRIGETFISTDEKGHYLTIAGSRAGKGVSAIIPNLLCYRGSMLVVDPKGELAGITSLKRSIDLEQDVFVLDPFKVARMPGGSGAHVGASFNPLSILHPDSDTLIEDAGLIADALVIGSGGENQYFDDGAKTLLEGLILLVATHEFFDGRDRHLVTVRELLLHGFKVEDSSGSILTGMEGLKATMESTAAACGQIKAAASDFFQRYERERSAVLSSARRHTKFLDFPAIQDCLRGSNFDLGALKTAPRGMTIYLCLPAGRMGTCSRWLRLFINLALEAMERASYASDDDMEATSTGAPVVFCMDEFPVLGYMQQIEIAAGQIAGFGVRLWTILQDITQLQALYKERWQTFVGNAGVLQVFGINDLATLEYVSKRLGDTSLVVSSKSMTTHDGKMIGASGESFSVQVQPLLTPEEIARFFGREDPNRRQLIIRPSRDPMILTRVRYYEHERPENSPFEGFVDIRNKKTR